jgi:hypothetical protein
MEELNHKARITAEARFDYEYCVCPVARNTRLWNETMIRLNPVKAMLYIAETELARRRLRSARSAERRYLGTDTERLSRLFADIEAATKNYGAAVNDPAYAELRAAAFVEYDKYDIPLRSLNKRAVTAYAEEYLNGLGGETDLENVYYIKAQYYDESLDVWLLLFFKRDEVVGNTRFWDIIGICEDDSFDEYLWESGGFKEIFTPFTAADGDWVVDERVKKQQHDREVELWLYGRNQEEYMVKDLLKNYNKYRAQIAVGGNDELRAKLDLLDKCVANLWDDEQKSLIKHYINLGSLGKAAKKVCLSKAGLQWRFDKTVGILELLMAETPHE